MCSIIRKRGGGNKFNKLICDLNTIVLFTQTCCYNSCFDENDKCCHFAVINISTNCFCAYNRSKAFSPLLAHDSRHGFVVIYICLPKCLFYCRLFLLRKTSCCTSSGTCTFDIFAYFFFSLLIPVYYPYRLPFDSDSCMNCFDSSFRRPCIVSVAFDLFPLGLNLSKKVSYIIFASTTSESQEKEG